MTVKKTAAILVAVLLSLTAVACGSKKADTASTADASRSEKQSDGKGGTTTTERSPATTDDSSSSSSSSGSGSSSDGSSGLGLAGSAECLAAYQTYSGLIVEAGSFAAGADQSQIDQFEQQTQDLKAKIPSAVQADFQTVADAYKQYAEAIKGIDFTDLLNPATQDKLKQASDALDSQSVKDAQDRIDTYFKTTCGN